MNSIGIVCEYNPFHNGHLHQLRQSRSRIGDGVVVCVMSGDFVQRGEAAVFSKFARSEAACLSGADLIVELPLPYCLSSAEGFASAAVRLLSALGCEQLSFGCECTDTERLSEIAISLNDPEIVQAIKLSLHSEPSSSYPQTRQKIISERLGEETGRLLETPNNILAIEYLKAIDRYSLPMTPYAVKRIGNAHDSELSEDGPLSATAIRKLILNKEGFSDYVPETAYSVFEREIQAGRLKNTETMNTAILSRLRMLRKADFERLADGSDGAGLRLYSKLQQEASIETIVAAAQTKRYPLSRIRRMMLCAALGIEVRHMKAEPPYARILAANKKGCSYLREISKKCTLPLITKAAKIKKLDGLSAEMFASGVFAHDLYCMQFVANDDKKPGKDWRTGPVIVNNLQNHPVNM